MTKLALLKLQSKKTIVSVNRVVNSSYHIYINNCMRAKEFILENYQGGLRKWFKDKWVNIGKKKKGGGHPECGTSGDKKGYAKCVPASKAASMSKKEKESATRRKRAAQNKAGRGGKNQPGQGNKPIRVSTKSK